MVNRSLPVGFGGLVSTFLRRVVASRTLQLFLIGGVVFVLFFYWRYENLPDEWYRTRDDGVITMSHARNLVDYGFVGVNPSGGRVEGFSAPVQFWVYAAVYALTGVGYDAFAAWQTGLGAFLLGAVFILFFRECRWRAVAITVLAGFLLSWHYSFLGWHGSGMENAVTHVLFLAAALILFSFARSGRIVYPWALVVFLASISRLDSFYYIGPVLVIFSGWWWLSFRGLGWRRGMGGCCFSAMALGLWAVYNFWRYVYFGDLMPNTAYAQGIEAGGWLARLGGLGEWENVRVYLIIWFKQGVYIPAAALLLLGWARRDRVGVLVLGVIGYVVVAGCLTPFFFGEARLDLARTTTHLAVFAVLGLGLMLARLEWRRMGNRKLSLGLGLAAAAGVAVFNSYGIPPYYMCCEVYEFDLVRQRFDGLARREELPRATVPILDLGVNSWHKQFNVVDLLGLGSPIASKLYHREMYHPFAGYFFDYAAPDFITGTEACAYYQVILAHLEFDELYRGEGAMGFGRDDCVDWGENAAGVLLRPSTLGDWVRADILRGSGSRERELIDAVSGGLSVEVLRRELAACQSVAGSNCVYVARTAYRFLPEFREAGLVDALNDVFAASRTRDYDLYLINGYRDGRAHRRAIEFLVNDWVAEVRRGEPVIRSDYDVFIRDGALVYLKSGCGERDTEGRFFLRWFPADGGDVAEGVDRFDFGDYGLRIGGHCFAARQLPGYGVGGIRTGQYRGEERLWQGEYRAGAAGGGR